MTISYKIINPLAQLIAGDQGSSPYLSGPELVEFFNQCGFDDTYGSGFPTRWRYVAERLSIANNSEKIEKIIEEFVDPRHYQGDNETVNKIVLEINALIKFDGLVLKRKGLLFKLNTTDDPLVRATTISEIDHIFIQDQIAKCQDKITSKDYSGAITNARTLLESVLIYAIETIEKTDINNDGNLDNLWSKTKKALKIKYTKDEIPDFVFQTLSGLDTVVKGLAGISNNAGDRHANKFSARKHHAKLAVNSSMTISDYIIDLMELRNKSNN